MTTVRALIAILAAIVFGMPAAMADAATYTWKGGAGSWDDAAMWATADAGAEGVPGEGSSVVFPAHCKTENVVYLSSNPGMLAAITIDSASRYTFRSTSRSSVRTIKGTMLTMSGSGGGLLVLDTVKIMGGEDEIRFATLAGLARLVLENSAEFAYPSEDNAKLEVSLLFGGKFAPPAAVQAGKLKIGASGVSIAPSGNITFASFENIGAMGYCTLPGGKVSFQDVSGIAQFGGEGTFESNTAQIKVAPEFICSKKVGNQTLYKGIAAISNGTVVVLQPETMRQGFAGATDRDNVYIGTDGVTLDADVTVNAVCYDGTINLNGHVLTVLSGAIRAGWGGMPIVSNGVVRVGGPFVYVDSTNNADERFKAELATIGNDDPWRPMSAFHSPGGSYLSSSAHSNFVGSVVWPFSIWTAFPLKKEARNCVYDAMNSVITASGYEDRVVRGIAGNCEVKNGQNNVTIWIGDCTDEQLELMAQNQIANCGVVVSANGIMAPGYITYDGGRRGHIDMISRKERMYNFLMDEGGTLQIAIHADGDNTYLKMSEMDTSYGWNKYMNVTLAGTLDIREYGKIQTGVAYPVVFYHPGKRTGKFDRVTINGAAPPSGAGYVVKYDVPQPDGSYAVVVSRKNVGTVIRLR